MIFKTPFHLIVSASSMGGKTTWTLKLIKEQNLLFDKTPDKTYYFYNEYNECFDSEEFKNVNFVKGLPDELDDIQKNSLCVFDDFMSCKLFRFIIFF